MTEPRPFSFLQSACRAALVTPALLAVAQTPPVVTVPAGASADQIATAAAEVRPHPRQLAWQAHEFNAFVHFGMNTFTDREWGDGSEEPNRFAPEEFDAGQWIESFRAAGMRGVVLTAKHHDGFCLWPTETTQHSVGSSSWRQGRGDVVRDVASACADAGMSFGVYLSPWDRNHPTFGSKAYQRVFLQQLEELCSNYGPLFEVWLDGAHCPADDPDVFDWQAVFGLVRQLQPEAVIAITGPDVRWVGNEAGRTRAQEWSVLPLDDADPGDMASSRAAWRSLWRLRERNQASDLGSRRALADARRLIWWPAETDVSIRPGWFWHQAEDGAVKPLSTLLNYWFEAVGGNATLLLNVPPNRQGLVSVPDRAVLHDLGDYLRATFTDDLADGQRRKTYAKAGEVYFEKPTEFDVIDLRENLALAGQSVEAFRIDILDASGWRTLLRSSTIGYRRLLRIEPIQALGVRYWVERSRGPVSIHHFSLHLRPRILAAPSIRRDAEGNVTISADGARVHYTLDGTEPGPESPSYEGPFPLPNGGTVHAVALPAEQASTSRRVWLTLRRPTKATARFGLAPAGFRVLSASSQQRPGERAEHAIDGRPETIWHSRYQPETDPPPHHLSIDLGQSVTVTGFVYLPRRDGTNGSIAEYEFAVRRSDGADWQTIARGTLSPEPGSPSVVEFERPVHDVGAIRLTSVREISGRPWASCAELEVLVPDR